MKKMKNIFLVFGGIIICLNLFLGCNNNSGDTKALVSDTTDFKQLVHEWNDSHSSKDVKVFSNLYDNSILFYGVQLDKNTCILRKLSLFNQSPDFFQQIFGDIQIEKINDNEVKCHFVKRVTVNQTTNDYPSYLTFKKSESTWKIVTEGDLVTDKNLAKKKTTVNSIPKESISGDFNGDGKLDYMWLDSPKINSDGDGCEGQCNCFIKFSDQSISSIPVETCIGGTPTNLGDLNKNGTDEIGLLRNWFTSCWQSYFVWTFINNQWIYAVDPITTHCNQWDKGVKPIEIDNSLEGNVIIRYSEFTDSDILIKTKSVKIVR